MCRNKIISLLITACIGVTLTGCSFSDVKNFFVTDTGSSGKNVIIKEDYLDTDALSQESVSTSDKYKTATVIKGDFVSDSLKQTIQRAFQGDNIYLSVEGTNMKFGDYLKSNAETVSKGENIAYIYTEVDDISLEEAKIKVERLTENYARAIRDNDKAVADKEEEISLNYNKTEKQILEVELNQLKLDRAHLDYDYQNQIADAKERLQKMQEVGSVYYIKAETDGLMVTKKRVTSGTELKRGDYIATVVNKDKVDIVISSQAEKFTYGSAMEVNTKIGKVTALCVSGGVHGLYGNLDTGKVTFNLVDDGNENFKQLTTNFYDNMTFMGQPVNMKNVLLIPKQAVTVKDDVCYVNVVNSDGTLTETPFVAGGKNTEYYLIISGLTEGTTVAYN